MTAILALTGDDTLRGLWADCAASAGAHLLEQDRFTADVRTAWNHAPLVLLGADLAPAAARYRLKACPKLIVIGTGELDQQTFHATAALRAVYVATLPDGSDWLADQLRPAAEPMLQRLRAAGFTVGYTHRDLAEHGRLRVLDWRKHLDADRPHVYVMFSDVARGECSSGQSTTVQRSNMLSLHQAFPGVFTDIAFSNVTALGAFAADLPPEAVDVLCRLATEYPIVDEHALAALEADEILDSWPRWVRADVAAQLRPRARALFDDLSDDDQAILWWDTVRRMDAWPEHDGCAVRWRLNHLVSVYATQLIAEVRRRRADTARPGQVSR